MTAIAIVDCLGIRDHATTPLAGGPSALERVISRLRSLPEISKIRIVSDREITVAGIETERAEGPGVSSLIAVLQGACSRYGDGVDAVVRIRGDAPFFDPALAARMLKDFRRYRAEYYFADGYPVGVAPEIVSPRILPAIAALSKANDSPLGEEGMFEILQKDINSFDLETEISRVDLREYRLSLTCDTRRNKLVCERLLGLGARDAETILDLIPANQGLLRTLPAFVSIQIAGGCPQACSYCPYPVFGGDILARRDCMAVDRYSALMDQVADYCEDAVIDLSLWGEPSLHKDFSLLAAATLSHPGLSLIVETSGIGWDDEVLARTASLAAGRVDWIVSLDETDSGAYARLRGAGFQEAMARAESLMSLFPGRVHVQAVRMTENEERLEGFYRGWKARTENVIIQKYDSFAKSLPDRAVADLSPLERRPCWHLARDMSVLLDGSVPLCRECLTPSDPKGSVFLGNVFTEGFGPVWEKGQAFFTRHIERRYPDICGRCDEYHTYNA